jgi:hypothetical protein
MFADFLLCFLLVFFPSLLLPCSSFRCEKSFMISVWLYVCMFESRQERNSHNSINRCMQIFFVLCCAQQDRENGIKRKTMHFTHHEKLIKQKWYIFGRRKRMEKDVEPVERAKWSGTIWRCAVVVERNCVRTCDTICWWYSYFFEKHSFDIIWKSIIRWWLFVCLVFERK